MKISCFLIAVSCCGLQMLMADSGKAQGLNEVKVTLELNNESLKTAFSKIEKQTDYRFAYNKKQIDPYRGLIFPRMIIPLQKLLDILLDNTDLSYRLLRNKIIIFQKDKEETVSAGAGIIQPARVAIKGKITNEKGEPVAAASVLVVGQNNKGTAADPQGEFTITGLKAGKYTLRISGVGFETLTREVTITDDQMQEFSFQLKSINMALDQVIVTGYSRQSKRDVTGAASTVSADVIAQTPVTDVSTALQGRVAGVRWMTRADQAIPA